MSFGPGTSKFPVKSSEQPFMEACPPPQVLNSLLLDCQLRSCLPLGMLSYSGSVKMLLAVALANASSSSLCSPNFIALMLAVFIPISTVFFLNCSSLILFFLMSPTVDLPILQGCCTTLGGASGRPFWLAKSTPVVVSMALVRKSEYVAQLSAVSRQRYEEKLKNVGLFDDPYCLENSTNDLL